MYYIIGSGVGYLLGCINPAYWIAKYKGIDIKQQGTKNAGASNATIIMGWKIGILVALFDFCKAIMAVYIMQQLTGYREIAFLAGMMAVLGHIFPFYMRFQGGKGFASYFGLIMATNVKLFWWLFVLAIVITVITDYIALATITTAIIFPVLEWQARLPLLIFAVLLLLSIIIMIKHRMNIIRMLRKEEIGLRQTWKKKR